MPLTEVISDSRYESGPREPPAVSVIPLRQGGHDGHDLRLADDPGRALVRLVGKRAQLGPCKGLLGDGRPNVDAEELSLLAVLSKVWREHRIDWGAHVLGSRARMWPRVAYRHRPGSWKAERLKDPGDWEEGETTYRVASATGRGRFGPVPIELALESCLGVCVGVVVRTPSDLCVTLARGSFVIFRQWPRQTADFASLARLLVSATMEARDVGLEPMREEAVEYDPFGAFVLEEAAALNQRTAEERHER